MTGGSFTSCVADVHVGVLGEDTLLDESQKPVLDVTLERAGELGVGQQTADSDASVVVLALVELPRSAVEVVNSSDSTVGPANRQLAALVLQPEHQLLGGGASRVTLSVRGHEVVADVALVGGRVGPGPLVGGGDRANVADTVLQVLGQTDEGITLGDVVGGLDVFDVPGAVPLDGLVTVGAGGGADVSSAGTAFNLARVVHHVVDDPGRSREDERIIGHAA